MQNEDNKKTKKAPTPRMKLGEYTNGDLVASLHLKGERKATAFTAVDLRRGVAALKELTADMEAQIASLGESG